MADLKTPKLLTNDQVSDYERNGCVFPIRIMSGEQALDLRRRFEALEEAIGGEAQSRFRIKAHLPFPWLHDLIRNAIMLDAVEDLIGPNILCWGSSFFAKRAKDPRFVSWHQDSTYYGLQPPETATAWVAFSDSTIESGCVRFIPGTQRQGILKHEETWDRNNLLVRGQRINAVDDSKAVDIILRAGEISIHHEAVIHGSNPNCSNNARIGLSIHYIAPHVRQTAFEGASALLVRGRDTHGYWEMEPTPECDFDPGCLEEMDRRFAQYKSGVGKLHS